MDYEGEENNDTRTGLVLGIIAILLIYLASQGAHGGSNGGGTNGGPGAQQPGGSANPNPIDAVKTIQFADSPDRTQAVVKYFLQNQGNSTADVQAIIPVVGARITAKDSGMSLLEAGAGYDAATALASLHPGIWGKFELQIAVQQGTNFSGTEALIYSPALGGQDAGRAARAAAELIANSPGLYTTGGEQANPLARLANEYFSNPAVPQQDKDALLEGMRDAAAAEQELLRKGAVDGGLVDLLLLEARAPRNASATNAESNPENATGQAENAMVALANYNTLLERLKGMGAGNASAIWKEIAQGTGSEGGTGAGTAGKTQAGNGPAGIGGAAGNQGMTKRIEDALDKLGEKVVRNAGQLLKLPFPFYPGLPKNITITIPPCIPNGSASFYAGDMEWDSSRPEFDYSFNNARCSREYSLDMLANTSNFSGYVQGALSRFTGGLSEVGSAELRYKSAGGKDRLALRMGFNAERVYEKQMEDEAQFTSLMSRRKFCLEPPDGKTPLPDADVVIVSDISSSMLTATERGKELTKEFAMRLLEQPGYQVGLASFYTVLGTTVSLTRDVNALEDSINAYVSNGATCIACGVHAAEGLAAQGAPGRRRHVIVITDGGENVPESPTCDDWKASGGSEEDFRKYCTEENKFPTFGMASAPLAACLAKEKQGAQVHVVLLGDGMEPYSYGVARQMAECGNGTLVTATDYDQLEADLALLTKAITNGDRIYDCSPPDVKKKLDQAAGGPAGGGGTVINGTLEIGFGQLPFQPAAIPATLVVGGYQQPQEAGSPPTGGLQQLGGSATDDKKCVPINIAPDHTCSLCVVPYMKDRQATPEEQKSCREKLTELGEEGKKAEEQIHALLEVPDDEDICKYDLGLKYQLISKPAVYFYPEKPTAVEAELDADELITKSTPEVGAFPPVSWKFTANPGSRLEFDDGREYPYLFYETTYSGTRFNLDKGWFVKRGELPQFFDEKLPQLGLNGAEAREFKEYWTKRLNESSCYGVYPVPQREIEDKLKLKIKPQPKTQIRVMLGFKPGCQGKPPAPPAITAPARDGFTMVEWGGFVEG